MKEAQPTRIIVLRSGAVGDCILSTPALSALRRAYPSAHLTLLGDPFSADLFKGSPDIDRLIKLDPKVMRRREYLTALLRLRRERFSLLVDLHGNSRTFLQTLLIGGKRRLGFETRHSRSIVYTHRAPYRMDVHTVFRQLELLRPIGVTIDPSNPTETSLCVTISESERREARALLDAAGLPIGHPYAVLHPGAGAGLRLKQWRPDRFAAVAVRIQESLGLEMVVTGSGEGERPVVEQVMAAARRPMISLFNKTGLRTLAAVLEGAALYVGCDTGPMHLSAALGTPVVALFGPTDPVRWSPWSPTPWRVIRAGLPCSPCPGKICPYNVECMSSLEVDQVFEAAQELCRAPSSQQKV